MYYPRQVVKYVLYWLYPFFIRIWKMPIVKSIDETLDKVLNNRCSVCRYGDGEILYLINKVGIPFQEFNSELRTKLIKILKSNNEKIIVCLPIGYHSTENLSKRSTLTWRSHVIWTYPFLKKYLDLNKTYYNTSMTRPYINFHDRNNSSKYFNKIKKIWEGREILLVEGFESRLGVGNDLFDNALIIERILAPPTNAFRKYNILVEEVLKHPKSKLILLALGPTATVMAFDLMLHEYRVIDIGNVDIEYEWFLRGATEKIKIPYKYSNEVAGGSEVENIINAKYDSQIIVKIT